MTTTTTKPAEAPAMPIADRLEHCARFTGLDAVRELLLEAAAAVRKRDAVVKLLEGELQARAQVQGEPVAWMHWSNGPVRVFMNKDVAMMELDRLNREYPLDADDRKMRPLIFGDTAPQPAQATQAEVTDGIRPEDFTVDVVVKPMGGFAPVNTQGVRVTHKPTGISVTCDAARSQHTNRQQAFEKLSAILALRPERVPMTDAALSERARIVDLIEDRACKHNGTHLLTLELNQLADVIKSGLGWLEYERYKHNTAQVKKEDE